MAGIGSIGGGMGGMGGGANPLSGMAGQSGAGGPLSGLADGGMGLGDGGGAGGSMGGVGVGPSASATASQGASFGDALKTSVITKPSATKAQASDMMARFAAGDTSIDPHQIALTSAKAGVEIQMATRTISSAVSAVRTLFQMQV